MSKEIPKFESQLYDSVESGTAQMSPCMCPGPAPQWLSRCEGSAGRGSAAVSSRHVDTTRGPLTMARTASLHLLPVLLLLPTVVPYCTWVGSNPYWDGAPSVEQVPSYDTGNGK